MKRVLVTCPPMLGQLDALRARLQERALEPVAPVVEQTLAEDALVKLVPDCDAWIAGDDPVSFRVLEAGRRGKLRAVVKWGVGVDNVDFAAAVELGVPIANTPGLFGEEVADLALGYLIGLARDSYWIDREVRRGGWPKPAGVSLADKHAAVVGYGTVGRALARRLLAIGMRVVAYDPQFAVLAEMEAVAHARWPERLAEADFLVLCCPLSAETRHLIGGESLMRVKPGLRVVNVARGQLIDEVALAAALADGRVHGAALDVFEQEPLPAASPVRAHERCIFGSHNGSNTVEAVRRASECAIELISEMLKSA